MPAQAIHLARACCRAFVALFPELSRFGTGNQRVVTGFGHLDQQLPIDRMLGDVQQLYEPQMIGAALPSVDHVLSLAVGVQETALWASQHVRLLEIWLIEQVNVGRPLYQSKAARLYPGHPH